MYIYIYIQRERDRYTQEDSHTYLLGLAWFRRANMFPESEHTCFQHVSLSRASAALTADILEACSHSGNNVRIPEVCSHSRNMLALGKHANPRKQIYKLRDIYIDRYIYIYKKIYVHIFIYVHIYLYIFIYLYIYIFINLLI